MKVRVRNAKGTSGLRPEEQASWVKYWEKRTGHLATKCSAVDCDHTDDWVGAHVKKVDGIDTNTYIVPLCNACNQRTDSFVVSEQLVSATDYLKENLLLE